MYVWPVAICALSSSWNHAIPTGWDVGRFGSTVHWPTLQKRLLPGAAVPSIAGADVFCGGRPKIQSKRAAVAVGAHPVLSWMIGCSEAFSAWVGVPLTVRMS